MLIKHIAGGQAFFSGVGLLLVAALVMSRRHTRTATIFWLLGLILIAAGATPLPTWFYVVAGLVSLSWIVAARGRRPQEAGGVQHDQSQAPPTAPRSKLTIVFIGVWIAGVVMEVPYHVTPQIPPVDAARLTIYADSVTAGMGEREAVTWPALLAEAHPIEVVDHSRMGATAASAALLAEQHPPGPGIVLLEIGGNDILGSTTPGDYEQTLDQLLRSVTGPQQSVVMLELPLPPFFNRYGEIQRQLAAKHGAVLIPKRFLLDVLLSDETTLDSIHLSQQGHQRMAEQVWNLIRPAITAK